MSGPKEHISSQAPSPASLPASPPPCPSAPFGGPLEVLEALTPGLCVSTRLMSLATERLWVVLPGNPYFAGSEELLETLGLVFLGAVIAFLMVWAEFEVGRGWQGARGRGVGAGGQGWW